MSYEIEIQAQDGSTATVPASKVVSDLQNVGVQATLSPDGQMLQYDLEGTPMEMPLTDFVEQSIGPVLSLSFLPQATDFTTVDPELRLGIENLPNDSLRRKYLELNLESQGIENPQLVGKGSDWALFDPTDGTYKALTNKPGLDLSELGQVGAIGAQALGSILGGALGAGAGTAATPGFGTFAGGAAGAALGGQLGRGAVDAYLAAAQPGYRNFLGSLGGEEFAEIANERTRQAALDMAFGGLAGGIGALVPALSKGAITRGGAAAGLGLEKAAGAGRKVLGAAQNPLGQQLGAELAFGTGPIQLGAWLAQAPAWLTKKAPQLMRWTGRKTGSEGLENLAEELGKRVPGGIPADDFVRQWQARFGGGFRPGPGMQEAGAEEVLGRAGRKVGQKFDQWRNARNAAKEQKAWEFDMGVRGRKPTNFMNENLGPWSAQQGLESLGKSVGRGAEAIGSIGRGVEGAIEQGMRGVYGATRAGLYPVEKLGQGMRVGFGLAQPLEYRTYGALGSRLTEEQF